jgi:hypothetical protein
VWYISMNDCYVFESDGLVARYVCNVKLLALL